MMKSKTLAAHDLIEFRLRKAALDAARAQFLMVQEAYQAWVKEIGKRHKIKGEFQINLQSGELVPNLSVVESEAASG